jgi:hypothetical protein
MRNIAAIAFAASLACSRQPTQVEPASAQLGTSPKPEEATNSVSPTPTDRQLARRARSIVIVSKLAIPYFPQLPVVEDEAEVRSRTSAEVANRCLAITICAAKGETGDQELVQQLITDWSATAYFSPKERAFIDNLRPTPQELVDYSWQYEAVHVLLWALNYIDAVGPPHQQCDVPAELRIINTRGGVAFVQQARLRSVSELLDMADLYYRINWAAVDARVKGKPLNTVHPGIAFERHRAINWLIRYMDAEWDDVTTDT